nr:unnamed protein product [Digitaria exilis]
MAGNLALVPVVGSDDDDRRRRRRALISYSLPEDIFEHVLPFLPPEDAARSSVLSKRWRARATVLSLSDEHHQDDGQFLPFARAALDRHGSPDIMALDVTIGCATNLGPSTAAWLGDAMERAVGSVSVTVTAPRPLDGELVIPRRLTAKLTSLTLGGADSMFNHGRLVFPAELGGGAATSPTSYGALAELSLSRVRLEEHDARSLGDFLSSCCPRLRKLRLRKVRVGGGLRLPPLCH